MYALPQHNQQRSYFTTYCGNNKDFSKNENITCNYKIFLLLLIGLLRKFD